MEKKITEKIEVPIGKIVSITYQEDETEPEEVDEIKKSEESEKQGKKKMTIEEEK